MNYHPAKKWVDLEEWGQGMDEFKLPPSDELAGKELKPSFSDSNQVIKCVFYDAKYLAWGVHESLEKRPPKAKTAI
jgi:hypothetical protein